MEEVRENERTHTGDQKTGLWTPDCMPFMFACLHLCQIFKTSLSIGIQFYPDSDQIPYVESGGCIAYNNGKGGIVERFREDGIVDLDTELRAVPEWISTKAMIDSWLADAIMHEIWVGSDKRVPHKISFSDLPWQIGKLLYLKQILFIKQLIGITKANAEQREVEANKCGCNFSRACAFYTASTSGDIRSTEKTLRA